MEHFNSMRDSDDAIGTYSQDLTNIKEAIAELANVVSDIKSQLNVVTEKVSNSNQLVLDLPNVTTTLDYHEEEQ
jgi:hypothetical protein|tara:strand:- start:542 stop:763 length:222 start_codon:yes stop_codon:yes gene_type:complete